MCWLEERQQWLENVNRIHQVLDSGKPILQKLASQHLNLKIDSSDLNTDTKCGGSSINSCFAAQLLKSHLLLFVSNDTDGKRIWIVTIMLSRKISLISEKLKRCFFERSLKFFFQAASKFYLMSKCLY